MGLLISLDNGNRNKCRKVNLWLMVMVMCLGFAQEERTRKILVIDPGHGGMDAGAIGVNAVKEKDVVLNIALEIQRLNHEVLDNEFDIYLTRYHDTLVSLSDRGELARVVECDLFVSIHCNAAKPKASGMEVYVYNRGSSNNKKGDKLARSIIKESALKLGVRERGVKKANFQVLRETVSYFPSILIETGFITNRDEAAYLRESKNIRALALSILLGIFNYFNLSHSF